MFTRADRHLALAPTQCLSAGKPIEKGAPVLAAGTEAGYLMLSSIPLDAWELRIVTFASS